MNLKIILFFSIILLILSAGAVSSADTNQIDVIDSSGFGDESLDVEDLSESTDLADEDNLILQKSGNSVDSDKGRLLDAMETNDDSLDDEESWKVNPEYSGKIIREQTIPIDLRQDKDALKEKLNAKESLPDVTCEAYELEDFNLYVTFMDKSGTDSAEIIREKLSERYQVIIPKEHSNTLVLKQDIRPIDKKIIIKITNGKDIIIDGQGHTIDLKGSSKHDHYFVVKSGNVIFKNINFINGYNKDGDKGGAISFEDKAIGTIINCTFKNCWAEDHGGAIADRTGNKLTVINSTFIGNKASDDNGGAIFCKGPLYVEGCLFESNKAEVDGGAIFCEKDVNVIRSVFNCNKASGALAHQCYGGAIRAKGNVYIDNSTFENNTSEDYGGAIYAKDIKINQNQGKQSINTFFINSEAEDNDGGALYSEGCVLANNALFRGSKAETYGGTIFCKNDVNVSGCVFDSNKASGALAHQCYGGAIRAEGNVYIDNSTFRKNYSADKGGAVYAKKIKVNQNQGKQSFNSFFIENEAGDNDGGAFQALDDVLVKNALFRGNKAEARGGAICTCEDMSVSNCLFESNKVSGATVEDCVGGAIFVEKKAHIDNSTFIHNYAEEGGAIFAGYVYINMNQNEIQPTNSFLIENEACDEDGGAIKALHAVNVKYALFRGNKAEDEGDAIYAHGDFSYSPVNIYDCVFVNGNSVKGKIHEYSSNGSFNSLSDLINDNDDTEISLNRNYTFNSTFVDDYLFTPGIKINRSLTINGNGFTIDGSHKARIFNISSDVHVKFLNINFINGNADRDFRVNGGAIYSLYNDCCLVENCTFIANTANFGGAMYGCTVKKFCFH